MLIAGIDDLGTTTQISEGWAYFVIESELLEKFSKEAEDLLEGIALETFHGKDYKRRFKDKYLEFLRLCRKYSEESKVSLVSVVLQNQEWKNQYIPFCQRVIKNVYEQNEIKNEELILSAQFLTSPLFTLQNLTKNLSAEIPISIIIDSHKNTATFNDLELEIGPVKIRANKLLGTMYNGYRKLQFPNSPTLFDDNIKVTKDDNSYVIQAADIIGNFSLSYIQKKLGHSSQTVDDKAEIFGEVFGDKFSHINIANDIELTETKEIKLKFDGQQTLKFGRFEETKE